MTSYIDSNMLGYSTGDITILLPPNAIYLLRDGSYLNVGLAF